MAKKVNRTTYAKAILEHLNSTIFDDLEVLCEDIGKFQCLIEVVGTKTSVEKKRQMISN